MPHPLNSLPINSFTAPAEPLAGRGNMAELVQAKDWAETPLGPLELWPQSLRTTVSLCLASNFPISIAWGSERALIYNDGYRPLCGDKHPASLGQDYKECWASAWDVLSEAFEQASNGQTCSLENQRIFLDRTGYLEETFFTFSFSPILNELGNVGGVFQPVTELTQQTLAVRRHHILRTIAERSGTQTEQKTVNLLLETLREFSLDLPFVLLYSLAPGTDQAQLEGQIGLATAPTLMPTTLPLTLVTDAVWPLADAASTGKAQRVEKLATKFGAFTSGPYPEPPHSALVYPIYLTGTAQPAYFLVGGVSARRALDSEYALFYDLLADAATAMLAKARSHEASGIGAAFGQEGVELHGGSMLLDRDFKQNTAFSMHLPAVPMPTTALAPPQHSQKAASIEGPQQFVASEQLYRMLIEEAPIATALYLGPEIRIQYANPIMLALWGKDASVQGKTIREVLSGPENQSFPALVEQVYATGEAYVGLREQATQLAGGQLKTSYFNFTCKPLCNEAGEVYGIHHTAIDVTEEVQSQQQIKDEKERARLAIEVGGLGVFESDLATQELVADQRFNEIFGFDGPQTHDRYLSVFHPEDLAKRAQALENGLQTGSFEYEARFVHAVTKQVRWVKIGGRIYCDAAGKPATVLGVAQDTTEQKNYTAALHESEQRFRILADAAPNQVWAVNPDSTIRYINRAFLDFVGVNQEQYLATGWGLYLPPEEFENAQQTLTEAISTRKPYRLEHRMRRYDGQYRWLLAQGAPSYYPNGELYGYVGSAIDITELKEANQQLVRTNTDLDNFIYTASHDLKAPISNIEGLLSTLAEELPTEQRTNEVTFILDLMQGAVERFKRTIEHLTDISKLQQEHTLVTTEVDLTEIVEDVRLDLAPLLQDTGTKLEIKVEGCSDVRFSAKNLRSVVYNLLSNAVKYHSPARVPWVQIHCVATPEHHVLTVTDNGQGIEARQLGQLFTMFQRFHTHVEGSGVGLYMVKKMVENAGGRITVESQVNVGSTFTVYFPR